MVVIMCADFILARIINPQSLAKTQMHFDWFVPDTPAARAPEHVAEVVQLYDRTVREDIEMLHQLQTAVQSQGYSPGRLSTELEVGVHRFQQTYMECLLK
jgi:phenylpropionate dioxygenase-like ring-hydroxylating dioxygenase large terminal subunit